MTQAREEIEKWAALSDEDWVALQVPRFAAIRPRCLLYAEFLQALLKQGCARFAPLALIEARAKSVPSFAEKILRKRKLYMRPKGTLPADPLARMTDLCGGRVIAQTSDQVQAVCRFIEEAFGIDWSNSEDVSRRLRPTEFGYRSVHYIVVIDPKKLQDAGVTIAVPPEILGLKAEIQVRTLLEHAWADIGHEMAYKTELRVPDRIHRQFASLAAVLEGVDRQFGTLVQGLEEFKSNFGAYHERKEVDAEIARLRIVLSYDSHNVDLAVKIAQLALSVGRHEVALEILEPYAAPSESRRRTRPRRCPGRNALGPSAQPGVSRKAAALWKRPAPIGKKTRRRCVRWPKAGCAMMKPRPASCFIRRSPWTPPRRWRWCATSNSKSPMSSNNTRGTPGGADDPQCDRPLPQADRSPRQSSLGLGQPRPVPSSAWRSRTRPWEPLGN